MSEPLAETAPAFGDQIKREVHQLIIEVGTKICANVGELAEEIIRIRRDPASAAERVGLRVAAAGRQPFSLKRIRTDLDRKDPLSLSRLIAGDLKRRPGAAGGERIDGITQCFSSRQNSSATLASPGRRQAHAVAK